MVARNCTKQTNLNHPATRINCRENKIVTVTDTAYKKPDQIKPFTLFIVDLFERTYRQSHFTLDTFYGFFLCINDLKISYCFDCEREMNVGPFG